MVGQVNRHPVSLSRVSSSSKPSLMEVSDCAPRCWVNSEYVSECQGDQECLCNDLKFQSVSGSVHTVSRLSINPVNLRALWLTGLICRLSTTVSTPSAKLLSTDQLYTLPSLNAPQNITTTRQIQRPALLSSFNSRLDSGNAPTTT